MRGARRLRLLVTTSLILTTLVAVPQAAVANDPPVANDDMYTTSVNTTLLVAADLGVLVNDFDPDRDRMRAVLVDATTNGGIRVQRNGGFGYRPDPGFEGIDMFTYVAVDRTGQSNVATVTIVVGDPDNNPPIVNDTAGSGDEDLTIIWLPDVSDPDGDTLTCTIVTPPTSGEATVSPDCTSGDYLGDADFNGTDSFTYAADDGNGGTDTGTVTILVLPVNDAPVGVDDEATTDEDTPIDIDVLANDTDVDGDSLIVTNLTNRLNGTTALDTDGSVIYTPDPDFNGTDSFSYTANDGTLDSGVVTVVVTVNPATNTPPVANDTTGSGEEDTTLIWLPDVSDPDGDTLTCTIVSSVPNGTATVSPDCSTGDFTGDPDFNGTSTFVYAVDDGNGGTDVGTVFILVLPVNDAPEALDDLATTDEDVPIDIDVLSNDSDVDGDALTVTNLTNGLNGTTTLGVDGSVIYTPDPNFNGTDTFTYTANDGTLDSNTATVIVTVDPITGAPTWNAHAMMR